MQDSVRPGNPRLRVGEHRPKRPRYRCDPGDTGLESGRPGHGEQDGSASTTVSRTGAGSGTDVYAIVRSGGRQHKVAVGDIVEIDKVPEEVGSSVTLTPLMLVDGDRITAGAEALSGAAVTAEVLGPTKGPKIRIMRYKNKTGYRRRQGHRQQYTQVKVTGIQA